MNTYCFLSVPIRVNLWLILRLPSLTLGLLTLDPVKALQDILGRESQDYRTTVRASGW